MTDPSDSLQKQKTLPTGLKILYGFLIVISLIASPVAFYVYAIGFSFFGAPIILLGVFASVVVITASVYAGIKLLKPKNEMFLAQKGFKPLLFSGIFCWALIIYGLNQPLYPPHHDSDAKSNLHNVFLGCKAYWAEHGSDKECDVSIVGQVEYGFVQSSRVSITAKGTENSFSATAQHEESEKKWSIDAAGEIQQIQ